VLLRVRMVLTPITADEGGYLAIARGWAHGAVLYRDVWVDRPQGLLVLFRFWDWVAGTWTGSLRILAMVFGVLLVVSTALIAREVAGHRAARWTALICGVLSAAPVLEGYIANGELLSGAWSAAAIAVALIGLSRPRPTGWLIAAGALSGVAWSVKQSGFDGILALLLWLPLVAICDPTRRRVVLRASLALVVGMAGVIGLLMLHGAATGWSRWWWAMVGYRAHTLSLMSNPTWFNLRRTTRYGLAVYGSGLLVTAVCVGASLRLAGRSLRGLIASRVTLLPIWLLTATLSFFIGGGFWRHYWLLFAAPVSALAGVAAARVRAFAGVAAAVAVLPCLTISIWVFIGPPATLTARAASDHASPADQQVASWFLAHRAPGDTIYVQCSSPAVYADVRQDPGFPYLWLPEAYVGPHARQRISDYLGNPARAPTFIAEFQDASVCDPTGTVARIEASSYRHVATVGSVAILRHNEPRHGVADG
jgi:hypothetical protein